MITPAAIRVCDFNRFIDSYLQLRLKMYHQPSSVEAAQRDLRLFGRFCKQGRLRLIRGKTIL